MSNSSRSLSCIKDLRTVIAAEIKAAAVPGIGNFVFENRQERAWPEESAFVVVSTPSFEFDHKNTTSRFYFATGSVLIDIYARRASNHPHDPSNILNVNDFLDDATNSIVTALQPPRKIGGYFGGLVSDISLSSIENNLSELGEITRGHQRIEFNVAFNVRISQREATDDFLRGKTTIETELENCPEEKKQTFVTELQTPNK